MAQQKHKLLLDPIYYLLFQFIKHAPNASSGWGVQSHCLVGLSWHLEICIFYVDLKLCSIRDCYAIKTESKYQRPKFTVSSQIYYVLLSHIANNILPIEVWIKLWGMATHIWSGALFFYQYS